MRFLLKVSIPVETGNHLIKTGQLAPTLESIFSEIHPEAVYFTAAGGERTAFVVVNMQDASEMPKVAEPFFLAFNANVEAFPAMLPEDLMNAGPAIAEAVQKYS